MNMAQILLASGHNDSGSSQFFTESARKLFVGLSLFLIETEHERDLSDYRQRTTLSQSIPPELRRPMGDHSMNG